LKYPSKAILALIKTLFFREPKKNISKAKLKKAGFSLETVCFQAKYGKVNLPHLLTFASCSILSGT